MKADQKDKIFIVIAIFASLFGIYRIIRLSPSILLFINDPFYLNNLKIRLAKGIIAQNDFYKLLLYMNFNFFIILSYSASLILSGMLLMRRQLFAKKIIFYFSLFLLIYSLAELSFFPWMTSMEIQKIFESTNFLAKLKSLFYFSHLYFAYLFFVITCYPHSRI